MRHHAILMKATKALVYGSLFGSLTVLAADSVTNGPASRNRACVYIHDTVKEIPWSIHVVKIDRSFPEFQLGTLLGKGDTIGMGTVSEQVKSLSRELGMPVAAINGDFYQKNKHTEGTPRDVQIRRGELISGPSGHMCFWIDPRGQYTMTNVESNFRAIWADGTMTPFALNQERNDDDAVLYTKAMGASTRTSGGIDMILERTTNSPWLPLNIGKVYTARVQKIRQGGNAPLNPLTLVFSIGPKLAPRLPSIRPGDSVQIATETTPSLEGVQMAIGGGPALVLDGKARQVNGIQIRNPRTAVGWNKNYLFLVEVDGRQSDLSVGMTLPELVAYMIKLGCEQAMNLDGGGSSTLWAYGNVMNSPSEGEERASVNSLVVVRRKGLQK